MKAIQTVKTGPAQLNGDRMVFRLPQEHFLDNIRRSPLFSGSYAIYYWCLNAVCQWTCIAMLSASDRTLSHALLLGVQAIEAYRLSKRKGSAAAGKPAATFASLKALVAGREVHAPATSGDPVPAPWPERRL